MIEPLVSVKMITYNHAPFIARAIEGVLQQQTNFPYELVIGEDCSTDGTREIVLDFQKRYPHIIRVITSDSNVGMKKNGYRTSKACRGIYKAYCEGDDYWQNPEKIQKQADYLQSHPDCGLVYSSYDVYHVESKKKIKDYIKYRQWEIPGNPRISDVVSGKSHILTCTVMIRRFLYEKIIEADPFIHKSDHFLMGDTQLWAEIATVMQLHYINESLATHIITQESATKSKDKKKELRFAMSNAEMLLYLCKKYNLADDIRRKNEAYWCSNALHLALYSRNAELADEVRRKNGPFTWKEWIRYYGAKNEIIHHAYRRTEELLNKFRRVDPWH